jgi:hypothetical protein
MNPKPQVWFVLDGNDSVSRPSRRRSRLHLAGRSTSPKSLRLPVGDEEQTLERCHQCEMALAKQQNTQLFEKVTIEVWVDPSDKASVTRFGKLVNLIHAAADLSHGQGEYELSLSNYWPEVESEKDDLGKRLSEVTVGECLPNPSSAQAPIA